MIPSNATPSILFAFMKALTPLLWTAAALVAFAANSILCRTALGGTLIDPGTFTAVRILSGAATLALLVILRGNRSAAIGGDWTSATALVAYAVPFSFAYVHLTAGTGALILFGAVQVTMIVGDLLRGRRPVRREWIGLSAAFGGLALLAWPGVQSPDPFSAGLMAIAGISWGVYSLRGKGATDPLAITAGNFLRSAALVPLLLISSSSLLDVDLRGILLAVISGAIASGLGYAIWYRALRAINATQAAVAQLLVPLLAALGGVAFLGESFTLRLFLSGTVIAGGVALAIVRLPAPKS